MNNFSPRSVELPPRYEPGAPDSGGKHNSPTPDGQPMDPMEHPLVEVPPRTAPEMPAKPRRDLPYADPERASADDIDDAVTDECGPPDTQPAHQPWQAPSIRSPWMTQPLRAMLPPAMPLPAMPLDGGDAVQPHDE